MKELLSDPTIRYALAGLLVLIAVTVIFLAFKPKKNKHADTTPTPDTGTESSTKPVKVKREKTPRKTRENKQPDTQSQDEFAAFYEAQAPEVTVEEPPQQPLTAAQLAEQELANNPDLGTNSPRHLGVVQPEPFVLTSTETTYTDDELVGEELATYAQEEQNQQLVQTPQGDVEVAPPVEIKLHQPPQELPPTPTINPNSLTGAGKTWVFTVQKPQFTDEELPVETTQKWVYQPTTTDQEEPEQEPTILHVSPEMGSFTSPQDVITDVEDIEPVSEEPYIVPQAQVEPQPEDTQLVVPALDEDIEDEAQAGSGKSTRIFGRRRKRVDDDRVDAKTRKAQLAHEQSEEEQILAQQAEEIRRGYGRHRAEVEEPAAEQEHHTGTQPAIQADVILGKPVAFTRKLDLPEPLPPALVRRVEDTDEPQPQN